VVCEEVVASGKVFVLWRFVLEKIEKGVESVIDVVVAVDWVRRGLEEGVLRRSMIFSEVCGKFWMVGWGRWESEVFHV